MAQLAQADMGEQGRDLADTRPVAEVEEPRRRRIGDPVDDDPLEAQGDTVAGLLGELEGDLLLGAGHEDPDGSWPQPSAHRRAAVLELAPAADQQVLVWTCSHDWHR